MKSALFESLNDRSNITNAYLKMLNESAVNATDAAKDDIEVYIPNWALTYIVNNDDSGIDEEEKQMVDEYMEGIDRDGYELMLGDETEEFIRHPEFGLGCDCTKCFLVKNDEKQNESADDSDVEDENDVVEDIAGEVVGHLYSKFPEAAFIGDKKTDKGDIVLSFDFSRTNPKVIKDDLIEKFGAEKISFGKGGLQYAPEISYDAIIVHAPKTVGESEENDDVAKGGWFDEQGYLTKAIPPECIEDCTRPGADAYEPCRMWVEKLGFDKGLDLKKAKGFLKSTGGYDKDDLVKMDPMDVAITTLWVLCGDIADSDEFMKYREAVDNGEEADPEDYMGIVGIVDALPFEESVADKPKRYRIVVTGIEWPEDADDVESTREVVTADLSGVDGVEGMDMEDIDAETEEFLKDSVSTHLERKYGVAPRKFRIAKVACIDGECHKKNEIVSQDELDRLKKENPELKDINEVR